MRTPEVSYQCHVITKSGKRCIRDSLVIHGGVSMCQQHYDKALAERWKEDIRKKNERETHAKD